MGLEITEYLERKDGGSDLRRIEARRQRIAVDAQKIFRRDSTDPLFVTIWWRPGAACDPRTPSAALSGSIASVVCELVLRGDTTWRADWKQRDRRQLCEYVFAVDAVPSRHSLQWESSCSAMVADAVQKIQEVLTGKESHVQTYRQACKTLWLLIVAEPVMSSYFSPDENFDSAVFETSFDRVFVYDGFVRRVIELKRTAT